MPERGPAQTIYVGLGLYIHIHIDIYLCNNYPISLFPLHANNIPITRQTSKDNCFERYSLGRPPYRHYRPLTSAVRMSNDRGAHLNAELLGPFWTGLQMEGKHSDTPGINSPKHDNYFHPQTVLLTTT